MTIKQSFRFLSVAAIACTALTGCNNEEPKDNPPTTPLGGYADPKGVMILNQGASIESSSLTYIAGSFHREQFTHLHRTEW